MGLENLEELAGNFALFDSWEDRYRYLIDLGRTLPPMDDALKTEENFVKGCTSRVWMAGWSHADEQGIPRFYFIADSDAAIVRGLIAILRLGYEGMPVDDIAKLDIGAAFDRLGLSGHLSPNRRNGFFAMAGRIRDFKP